MPPLGAKPALQRLVPAVLGLGEGHPALGAQVHALVAAAALDTGRLVELSTKLSECFHNIWKRPLILLG